MNRIKLAVVDDQQLFRKGLVSLLKEFDDMEVITEASNGYEFTEQLKIIKPDVVLLDYQMPVMNGMETVKFVKQKYPDIKIIILTMFTDQGIIIELIKKGTNGFLMKGADIDIVSDAIHHAYNEGYYFNDYFNSLMLKNYSVELGEMPEFRVPDLSVREIEIIQLICKQYTNKEIAEKLFISARTVDGHRDKILRKTNAKNVVGIMLYAIRNNLLD